jgi:hypothetical protein
LNFNLSFQYSAWFILLCILAGVAYAFILYYRNSRFNESVNNNKILVIALAVVRFILVTLIALLLLSPFLRLNSNETQKPIIVIAADNSLSIHLTFKKDDSSVYINNIKKLTDDLSKNYDVKTFSFGDKMHEGLDFSGKEKVTDISNCLNEIGNDFLNQNLGAVILATDGIYNQGDNPLYSLGALNAPIYTIALGDTTVKKDLWIADLYYNKTAYLGNNFIVKANIEARGLNGKQSVMTVSKIDENDNAAKLSDKTLSITGDNFEDQENITISANVAGVQHYRILLSAVDGEATKLNNVKDFFVEVLQSKQKILIVGNSPHPDIGAIKIAIENNQDYQCDVKMISNLKGDVAGYDLVILHQVPSDNQPAAGLIQKLRNAKVPLLFILGSESSLPAFDNAQKDITITGSENSANEALPSPDPNFNLFNLTDATLKKINSFPPLDAPYGTYKPAPTSAVWMYQKIGNVTTNYPLILFNENASNKEGVICGDGLWRWNIYDYVNNNSHDAFNEVVSKLVEYLSHKPDTRQFRVNVLKSIFSENETVHFDAQLINETGDPINSPDVSLAVKNNGGKEFRYTFDHTDNSYSLDPGYFPSGNYSYSAQVTYNNKNLTDAGVFAVSPIQLEALNTTADFHLLHLIAAKSGGKFFYPNQTNELKKIILASQNIKPVIYTTTKTESVINFKWLFILLTVLLCLEWFLRKYFGGY